MYNDGTENQSIPIQEAKRQKNHDFFRQAFTSDISSWHHFDRLDCSENFARYRDSDTTFEHLLQKTLSEDYRFFIHRREVSPEPAVIYAITICTRTTVQTDMVPVFLEKTLRGEYERLEDHAFYTEKSLRKDNDTIEVYHTLPNLLPSVAEAISGEPVDNLTSMLTEVLPPGFVFSKNIEKFIWWFCHHNDENLAALDEIFTPIYGMSMEDFYKEHSWEYRQDL